MRNEIKKLSSSLSVGNSGYYNCPNCYGTNKLGITKHIEGIVYQCFKSSCNTKGFIQVPLSNDAMQHMLKHNEHTYKAKFKMPDYWIKGFASDDSLKFAEKYGLLSPFLDRLFKTFYDPKLHRQVFLHHDIDDNVVGAMGRALEYGVVPKAYIYPNSVKTPFIVGLSNTAVVVEDILSSISIYNAGYTGIALSGTSIILDHLSFFKGFDRIIICLDKDAQEKSLELKKLLDFYCKDVIIIFIEHDFKDLTIAQTKEILQ